MPFSDPLAFFKIPGLAEAVTPLSEYLGYHLFPRHVETILFSALFYHVIFLLSSLLSPRVTKEYRNLPYRTQLNYDIHVVSMVQCILILSLSLPMFGDPVLAKDHIYGYTPYGGFVSAMAIGYFVWDSIVQLWYIKYFGVGFVVHGIAAGFVFLQGMRPMLIFYCPHFLLFELSTPFLNINWFSTHVPNSSLPFKVKLANGICLLASFFFARIIWGFYQAYYVAMDLLFGRAAFERTHPLWVSVGIVAANLSLDFLNVFWFYKMQLLARRAIAAGSGPIEDKTQRKAS